MSRVVNQPRPQRAPKPLLTIPSSSTSDETESWIMTYLDVITLVLTLFVLLVALSTFLPAQESTAEAAGPAERPGDSGEFHLPLPEGVDLVQEPGRISLQIRDNLLFRSGEARLTTAGLELLGNLYPSLAAGDYPISVEGHTDNVPIATALFPSNWELSTGRATSVLRELIELGVAPERLRAIGYADTQPAADNDSAEGRARNRRVGLILHLDGDTAPPPVP